MLIPAIKKLIPLSVKVKLKSMLVSAEPAPPAAPLAPERRLRPCASSWPTSACECDMQLGAFKQARLLERVQRMLADHGIEYVQVPGGNQAHLAVDAAAVARVEELLGGRGFSVRSRLRRTGINEYDFPSTRDGLVLADHVPAEHSEIRVVPVFFCSARRKDAEALGVLITTFNDVGGMRLFHSGLPQARTVALPPAGQPAEPRGQPEESIDFVITTVDGSDPAWQERFSATLAGKSGQPVLAKAANAARYTTHDELRFVLRSIHYYAPYARTIHIVTDAQCPDWLDTTHERINLVDHRDIIEPAYLPCFNSDAIESCLWRIPGLSERFVYFNDDVLLMAPTDRSTFFSPFGLPRFFPSPRRIPDMPAERADSYTMHAHLRTAAALEKRGYARPLAKYRHVPFAARKSTLQALEEEFAEELSQTRASPLRSERSYATISFLYPNYALARGDGVLADIAYQYVDLAWPDWRKRLVNACRRTDVVVACVNESHDAAEDGVEDVDATLAGILSARFPSVAPWERGQAGQAGRGVP